MEKIFLIWFSFLLFLNACQTPLMTTEGFESIPPGTPIEEVEQRFGAPYEIEKAANGVEEYTYIQRMPISSYEEEYTYYTLYVMNGKVTSKSVKSHSGSSLNYR